MPITFDIQTKIVARWACDECDPPYQSAINLTPDEYAALTEADLEARARAEFTGWQNAVTQASQPPTREQQQADYDAIVQQIANLTSQRDALAAQIG
jgi:cell pole-organizing protein PopZ